MLLNNYKELVDRFIADLSNETNLKKAIENKNIFSKKYISPMYDDLKNAPGPDKKEIGQFINQVKSYLDQAFEDFSKKLEAKNDCIDVTQTLNPHIISNSLVLGHQHVLNIIADKIVHYFQQFDFQVMLGNEIVDSEFNFSRLNIPESHPARNPQDSFYFDDQYLLRTHCTVTSAMAMDHNQDEDIRIISFGNVYRNDDDDATHSHQFMQVDIVWVRDDLTLANLKYLINGLLCHLFGEDTKTRYRLSMFPFTEPSFEVDIACFNCKGKGCNTCKNVGWIEVLGAGMLHPNVFENSGLPKSRVGLAAGIGIDRIAMLYYGIKDIRDIYSNNIKFNQQF